MFVRIWMRNDKMLFTGGIRNVEDERFELTGDDSSNMMIRDLEEADSGSYDCRIMVEEPVSVTHSLTVTRHFSIQADPVQAMVNVPLRGESRFGCKVTGGEAEIEWTRDGGKFSSSGSYEHRGDHVEIRDATIQVCYQNFEYLLRRGFQRMLVFTTALQSVKMDRGKLLPSKSRFCFHQRSCLLRNTLCKVGKDLKQS